MGKSQLLSECKVVAHSHRGQISLGIGIVVLTDLQMYIICLANDEQRCAW
jgi:hypothetical protein